MNSERRFQDDKYKNPDNDPRGPYLLTDVTAPFDRSSLRYEWHGKFPPEGRSWRFSKELAEELERDGRIVFSSSGQPRLKRYLYESREQLRDLLHGLPNETFEHESDFTRKVIPRLAQILNYAELETFYDYGGKRYRADVVLSSSIESKPWVVLELKKTKPINIGDWIYQARRYLDAFDCHIGVVVSPEILVIISGKEVKRFDLRALTAEQSEEILRVLERNAQPSLLPDKAPTHGVLVDLIESVERTETNEEKGKSLEALARFLFDSVPPLRCKYSNLQTRSSEIDLVIEYDRSKGTLPLFEELGRYCLVECKNWSKPVGVAPVRDFMGKLDKCKTKLGVIFSKNGVTGVDAGADALREIQSRFDRDGLFLLVFSLEDLRGIRDGKAFSEALDRKADSLRFDTQGC
jgi:hypothetical protein